MRINALGLVFFILLFMVGVCEFTYANPEDVPESSSTPPSQTRVFSCSVDFPLDSVRFDESSIQHCFDGVDTQRISYIHVIATASTDGSQTHNLYLSTRRAGAIEGYLKNRFKDIDVHAFGGGANPKFGKLARIFIVESPLIAESSQEQIEATDTSTQPKVQIEYIDRPKGPWQLLILSGLGQFQSDRASYSIYGLGLDYSLSHFSKVHWLASISTGLRYLHASSNARIDLHSTAWTIGGFWTPMSLGSYSVAVRPELQTGIVHNTKGTKWDASLGLLTGLTNQNLEAGLALNYGHHLQWMGIYVKFAL